jgi:hypothetical protein
LFQRTESFSQEGNQQPKQDLGGKPGTPHGPIEDPVIVGEAMFLRETHSTQGRGNGSLSTRENGSQH